jgi:deoxyribonuclease V
VAYGSLSFPYIPTLLSFREAPVLLEALAKLKGEPETILVDGQGVAHPRGLGLAAHLGLHVEVPTVGCAKSRLIGTHEPPGRNRGDHAWLDFKGRRVGVVVRTREGVRPLYVSPGNRISLSAALGVVLACLGRFRLPEPLRQAHLLVERRKRAESGP